MTAEELMYDCILSRRHADYWETIPEHRHAAQYWREKATGLETYMVLRLWAAAARFAETGVLIPDV